MVRDDIGWEIASFVLDCFGAWTITLYVYVHSV